MASNGSIDLDFDISKLMVDPFKGTLQFTVKNKIRITYFEFSTHDLGCRRTSGRGVKYGLKLTLTGKTLFKYHNTKVDVQVNKNLILTPGNTYKLESWLGGHTALKPGQTYNACDYNYAEVSRSDVTDYGPFEFVFAGDEDKNAKPTNQTCIYVITYEMIDD